MSFFEIFGMIFMGIILLNAAIGIWAIRTAKSDDSFEFSHSENNLHRLNISKV